MRRLGILVALAVLALSSCSATLRVTATAPAFDNAGTCSLPVLYAAPPGALRVVHFAWTGPAAGEDSVIVVIGSPASLTITGPPGTYAVRGWASSPGWVGCDTTITRTATVAPWRVAFQ